jgi:transposase
MMKNYPESAVRRSMKVLEVILRAVAREIKWIQAAVILGVTPRTVRRLKTAYQEHGFEGLTDKRRGRPSHRRAPYDLVQKVLCLYVNEYFDFNVKHFHEQLQQKHGIAVSYTWTKNLLQEAGYVKRGKGRGGHRRRRERRALLGQMLHLDGSSHEWLALRPGEEQTLLLVVDDATGKNLAAWLVEAETTKNCLGIMWEVVARYGIPAQLYTDRHSIYWYTRKAGGKVDRERLTQFGRAMEELGVEMIPGYSPQARGRSERWNGTWQGRLVAELRQAGIDHLAAANRYIQEVFLPQMNEKFAQEAAAPGDAFVGAHGANLPQLFAIHHEGRTVANDNTVRVNNLILQLEKSPFRPHFAKCLVDVLEHLDGTYTVIWKKRPVGRYDAQGQAIRENPGGQPPDPRSLPLWGPEKRLTRRGKGKPKAPPSSPDISPALGSLSSVALSSGEIAIG